jgi:hypothetical protein
MDCVAVGTVRWLALLVGKIERVDRVPWQIRGETEARVGGSCDPTQTGDARDRQPLSLADAR